MTKYVGEGYRVTAVPRDDDGNLLTDTMVTGLTIEIWDPEATKIVDGEAMTWDEDKQFWFYIFDSAGKPSGSFNAKVTITGLDGRVNWEWKKRVRLARDPVPTP